MTAKQSLRQIAPVLVMISQEQAHCINAAKYIGNVCELYDKLFIVILDMEVIFVFSKKDFHLFYRFIQAEKDVCPSPASKLWYETNVPHVTISFLWQKV